MVLSLPTISRLTRKTGLLALKLAAARLGIRHKLICPYTPHHNGKVERSHREDQKRFYNTHRFFSFADFGVQFAAHQNRSNDLPMRPLAWLSPKEKLAAFFESLAVQDVLTNLHNLSSFTKVHHFFRLQKPILGKIYNRLGPHVENCLLT